MAIPSVLQQRYRRLFRFYDRSGDGRLTLADDHGPAAEALAARWHGRDTPFPDLLGLLLATYRHEGERRNLDGDGAVDEQEFVASHAPVIEAFARLPEQARSFIAKSAGGFFDCLDLDRDGCLDLADLQAYAAAYGQPTAGIQANLARMLAAFDLPPDRLPKAVFLELVAQYWFDPSADAPGRWLFDLGVADERQQLPSLGLMALAVGISVANPYYAQSLLPSVEAAFGLQGGQVLLGPMATQLGMAAGFLLVLPLGDGTERRRLLTLLAAGMALACGAVVLAPSFGLLVLSWFGLGVMALIPSLLPPFLTAFTAEEQRGRMLGIVLSGHFSGVLLSRSVSGVVAQLWGWRAIYGLSALAMLLVAFLFARLLPPLPATDRRGYWALQRSLLQLWRSHGRLRRSCLSQALLFGSFTALWSAAALYLGGAPWHFGPALIGSFGLVGLVSILAAPWVGRLVDRLGPDRIVGWGVVCTGIGVLVLGLFPASLPALVLGLMAVDLGVQASFVANQARIYAIDPAARSRMSGQFFLIVYLGAAACSLVISLFWSHWQWSGTTVFALVLVAVAFVLERRGASSALAEAP